jgi:hypothetical protein
MAMHVSGELSSRRLAVSENYIALISLEGRDDSFSAFSLSAVK